MGSAARLSQHHDRRTFAAGGAHGKVKSATRSDLCQGGLHRSIPISNRRNTVSAKTQIAAAAIGMFIAAAPEVAQARGTDSGLARRQRWDANAMSGAYAAATRSSRAKRPAQRSRVSQPNDASAHRVTAPDGRDRGADPDAAIRFQLRRDSGPGM